jgi:hypothetical protein
LGKSSYFSGALMQAYYKLKEKNEYNNKILRKKKQRNPKKKISLLSF